MIQRRLVLLALVLLLLPVGIVTAHSSANYVLQRFVVVGGGSANSASFFVTSVIGQPATDVVSSANYQVSGGFLYPIQRDSNSGVWLPMLLK